MDRQQLADFLRTRREALQPEDVGLSRGPRRRTRGLRREEVATLSGMSTDYYARLEQERGPQPSEQMLAAIARGLRLDLDERDHLFQLAGHNAPARALRTDHISPGLMRVLDRLADTPAQVIGGVGETLIQTPPAVALLGDQTSFTGMRRSTPYRWFTDPTSRRIYPEDDHDIHSRNYAADLRRALAREGSGSEADRIVRALLDESPEFADRWARHEVARRHGEKRMQHAELGIITLHCQLLLDEEQAQTLLVFTARPGTDDHDKLALLSVIGTQQLDPEAAEQDGARTP